MRGLDLQRLYSDNYADLLRMAVLMGSDRSIAEDCIQDVFEQLVKRTAPLDDPGRAIQYVRVAVINRTRSSRRRNRLFASRSSVPDSAGEDASVTLLQQERDAWITSAVSRLPRRQREVVVLRYWSDLPLADIAETLQVSLGTVKKSLHRAQHALSIELGAVVS